MRLFVFGLGYSGQVLARRLAGEGWRVAGTGRGGTVDFDDVVAVRRELALATHVLSSVPPIDGSDPVLERYLAALNAPSQAKVERLGKQEGEETLPWLGYLSSTGVYGDAAGAWVDETAPIGTGRRAARSAADAAWLALGARVFRLPGIYGPGRSALERARAGTAHRTGLAGQVFSRVHVDDIATGVIAGFDAPAGAYNLADDRPASHDDVVDFAARLLGLRPPPLVSLDTLSPMARGFYAENRRIATTKAKRLLGWRPLYPDYRTGLRSVSAMSSPAITSTPPANDSVDQR